MNTPETENLIEVTVTSDLPTDYIVEYVPPGKLTMVVNWFRMVILDLFGYI